MSVCQRCWRLNLRTFEDCKVHFWRNCTDKFHVFWLTSLVRGDISGCSMCSLLYADLKDEIEQLPFSHEHYHVELGLRSNLELDSGDKDLKLPLYNLLRVRLTLRYGNRIGGAHHDDENVKFHEYALAVEPGSAASISGLIGGRYLGCDPGSDNHIAQIQEWVQNCWTNHPKCQKSLSAFHNLESSWAPLPTRCLEVGLHSVRLVDTDGTFGTYVSVSHRWSETTEVCKTTPKNVGTRKTHLELAEFPKAFLDTFELARRIGVRYVWIDSICIIQHADDWAVESLKMAQYYQNALFNVAITGTTTESLFAPRAIEPFRKLVRLPYRNEHDTIKGYIYIYKTKSIDEQFRMSSQRSALAKRGWVFQEWLLSNRTLYFTPEQLFFECQSARPISESSHMPSQKDFDPFTFKCSLGFDAHTDTLDKWYLMVGAYSRLELTKPESDRIVALAGIASETGDALREADQRNRRTVQLTYTAGLWMRDIQHALLWECEAVGDSESFVRIDSFPSWSWASLMAAVRWPERRLGTTSALEWTTGSAKDDDSEVQESDIPLLSITSTPNIETRTYLLSIKTKILPVLVHSFINPEEAKICAAATGESKQREPMWNGISTNTYRDTLVGWASIERRQVLEQSNEEYEENEGISEAPCKLHALQVSKYYESGGLAFGYIGFRHPVYAVLYCIRTSGGRYQRVGVGRIFAKEAIQQFDQITKQTVELY